MLSKAIEYSKIINKFNKFLKTMSTWNNRIKLTKYIYIDKKYKSLTFIYITYWLSIRRIKEHTNSFIIIIWTKYKLRFIIWNH